MSLSFKKTCNVAIASVALAVSQHFAGEKVYQGSCFVKEAGALNMKLQMQRSVPAEVTAESRVPPPRRDDVAVNVVNYSYTGHRSSGLQEKGVDPSDKNVVIVDPAGAQFMKSNVRGNQANGLSAMLYRLIRSDGNRSGHYGGYWTKEEAGVFLWHPTTSIPLPAEASTNLKKAGDAFYVYYNKDMVNDEVELTNELSVIHSIGPDGQVYKEESINDFKDILFHTYANAFTQFRDRCHGKKELWINPVSSGIFAPSWMKAYGKWKSDEYLKEFAELTAEVVKKAINESQIQGVDIKMHIFEDAEFYAFNNAFGEVFADNDNQANLAASLLRSAETLAVAKACTPDKAGELQKIQTDRAGEFQHVLEKRQPSVEEPRKKTRRGRSCFNLCGGKPRRRSQKK